MTAEKVSQSLLSGLETLDGLEAGVRMFDRLNAQFDRIGKSDDLEAYLDLVEVTEALKEGIASRTETLWGLGHAARSTHPDEFFDERPFDD